MAVLILRPISGVTGQPQLGHHSKEKGGKKNRLEKVDLPEELLVFTLQFLQANPNGNLLLNY